MPTINQEPHNEEGKGMTADLNEHLTNTSTPTVVCGVNRKINIGNYENIDVYFGMSLPVYSLPDYENIETFKEAVVKAAEEGFRIASSETGKRYNHIKNLQKED